MNQETGEELPITDEAGINAARRAEAAARAQASTAWVMAALITANGGAGLALMGEADGGPATIAALALFMTGVTAALVAGKLSANSAHNAEALFVTLIGLERSSRDVSRAERTDDPSTIAKAAEHYQEREAAAAKAIVDFDGTPDPDRWLVTGILCFFFGCTVAGFALF